MHRKGTSTSRLGEPWGLRWELGPEQKLSQASPASKRQGGWKAELRGFAGGCARKPLEQPYGCSRCWAPPGPVSLEAASQGPCGGGTAAPQLLASRGAVSMQDGCGAGTRGLGIPAKLCTPWPTPSAPKHKPTANPWALKGAALW